MLERRFAIVAALVLTRVVSASAQQFPADEAYRPWPCQLADNTISVMTDDWHDEAGATAEKDLVGDVAAPTGLRAADPDFLYVRLRVDEGPAPGGSRAWGLLVDTNGDPSLYEVMLLADGGGAGTISIYRNTSGTPGDARDPPDSPPVSAHSWAERARAVTAPGSLYGVTTDYFVDFAFSWSELAQVGIGPATPVRVWAATSSGSVTTSGMNGDFACRYGVAPTLNAAWPGTAPDPVQDSDGDGFSDATEIQNGTDPYDSGSHPAGGGDVPHLAGGGGCNHGPGGIVTLSFMLASVLLTRRWLSRR